MRLDRRQFHSLALAFLANGIVAHGAGATALSPAADRAVIALNRLSFGASAAAIEAFNSLGKQAWLDRQLSLRPEDDAALAGRLARATLRIEYEAGNDGKGRDWPARKADIPYRHLDATGPEILALINYDTPMDYEERIRPAREVQAASLIRAVHAEAQLREVMTQFWHNHFNVNALRDETTAANFPAYDRVMRDNALGNFRTLLGQMARSPSMLFYLNNEASRASPANENFARELLELHTLGAENYFNGLYDDWKAVPGAVDGAATGYIDQDVYEVARAFTGWSYGDGRWIADGDEAPRTGAFHYIDAWHDPYQKRILGHEFRPNGAPLSDGDRTLDLLARHPGTARFISRKLIRRLVLDTPDEAFVDATADIFLAHADADDQLAQVVRFIVMSDAFDTTPPQKLKRPFEFLASLYRIAGAEVATPSLDFLWHLGRAGWAQHEHRPPNGPSDLTEEWANTNTVKGLVDLAFNAFEDWFGVTGFDPAAATPKTASTWSDGFAHWVGVFGGDPAEARIMLAEMGEDPDAPLPLDNPEWNGWLLRTALGMSALTPHFLFR